MPENHANYLGADIIHIVWYKSKERVNGLALMQVQLEFKKLLVPDSDVPSVQVGKSLDRATLPGRVPHGS